MKSKAKILQAIKVWIVIYPSITLFNISFGSYLASLPLFLKTFILTAVLVPWMVFAGLPFISYLQQLKSRKAVVKDNPQS
jgi:antibiotic biosynthesis monooxygenase (ABM) superfamily enzyme